MMTTATIAQIANKYMSHDMISKHTDLPDFPEGRVALLQAVLSHQPAVASQKELLSVVTSLVQMALDTHDMVNNDSGPAQAGTVGMRAQQLKVLAGDYFSSRFYQLLSQAGHIDQIRRLSEAVCDINTVKMKLYAKMTNFSLSAEEYVQHRVELKTRLFHSFSAVMSGVYERFWLELVDIFSRCEVLLHELVCLEVQAPLADGWGVWHILEGGAEEDRRAAVEKREDVGFMRSLFNKYAVGDKLSSLLEHSVTQLQAIVQRLQSDKLLRELQPLIEPFVNAVKPHPAAALKELG
jgi:heptaprenyl diphosphate synthase